VDPLLGARKALQAAESRSEVQIRTATTLAGLDDARMVFDSVWLSSEGGTEVQPNMAQAIIHAGGYCSVAYVGDQPVGAALGFVGRHRDSGWHVHLHSHVAAVLDGFRDRHIGSTIKTHQRVWALENEVPFVVWSFDPLVRRNAYVNLVKLGAQVRGYEIDFYGPMDDVMNAGDPSDRMFAWWEVSSDLAVRAAAGELSAIDLQARSDTGEDHLVVALPEDIIALRQSDPDAAKRYRFDVRQQLTDALAAGYRVTGISTNGDYVLERA
jgi:predicted GNAT superfamily acetyltransferase